MKSFFTLCLAVAPTLLSQAQTTGRVTGRLLDEHQQTVAYATVLLQPVADTTAARVELATNEGAYAFTRVPAGRYQLTVLMLGYQRQRSGSFELAAGQILALPATQLRAAAHALQGVQVTGQKPLLEMQAGKMILNVAGSPASAGATAIEVLQRVPGLVVMGNRLSLAGREGIIILLDGRTTHYTDVVSLLKDYPSGNIDRIEVITQPGAQYDAAGSAGIINIILKKNTDLGTNGSLQLSNSYGRFGKVGTVLDLNHRAKGLNLYGGYTYAYRKTYDQLNTDRLVPESGGYVAYHQESYQPRTSNVNIARLGADYSLTPHQTLGILFNGYITRTDIEARNSIEVNGGQTRNDTRNDSYRPTNSYAGNLNYRLTFAAPDHELLANADYSHYATGNDSRLTNTLEAGSAPMQQQQLGFNQQTAIKLGSSKLDYLRPLGGQAKLSAGAKVSAADIDSNLGFSQLVPGGWQSDAGRSDHFHYQERIAAGYLSFSRPLLGAQFEAGLRAEQTHSVATSIALNKTVERDYLQFFPSVSFDKPLTKVLGVNVGYSRRIDRPSYQDLNPSIVYLDPYTQQKGNPFLQPQLTNSYKLAVTYQQQPVLQLAYSRTNNAISLATVQQDSVVYSTSTNLGRLDNYSATLNFPLKLGTRVSGYGGTVLFYNQYHSEYLGGQYDNGKLSATFYLQTKLVLGAGVTAEVSGYYQTAGVNGLLNYQPFGALNLGLQKSIWKNQATVRLSGADVFFTSKQRGTVSYQDMNIHFLSQTESQLVRLSFTYKFGNQSVKAAAKRATGLDEERGRVKTDKE